MSASEEDTELKELVIQALENNGVLAKIRAQLRASVFLALDEANSLQKNKPLVNKELQDYLSTKNGRYVAYLVHNFLTHFKLDSTLSVYELESYHGQMYGADEHETISDDLGIRPPARQLPLLDSLLQMCSSNEPRSFAVASKQEVAIGHSSEVHDPATADNHASAVSDRNSERSVGEGQESPRDSGNTNRDDDDDDDDFFNDPPMPKVDPKDHQSMLRRPLDTSAVVSAAKKSEWDLPAAPSSPARPSDFGNRPLKPLSEGGSSSKPDPSLFASSILGSLRGAPPLADIKAKLPPLNLWKDNSSPSVNQSSKLDVSAPVDDYEEDFQSSASIRSDPKTGTELSIEEDIDDENQSFHLDDLLSNGATSENEDATTDHTVSHVSTTGVDFLESI